MKHLLRALAPVVLLLGLLGARPAHAFVTYFQGIAPSDFLTSITCKFQNSNNRSNWTRGSVYGGCTTYNFTPQTNFWFHGWYLSSDARAWTPNTPGVLVLNGNDGKPAFAITIDTTTAATYDLAKISQAGTYTTLAAGCTANGLLGNFDLHLNYAAAGSAVLYFNGTQVCSYTGDTTDGVRTGIQSASLNSMPNGNYTYWSEVLIADSDTRSAAVYEKYPTGNGTSLQWANSSGTTPCTSVINQASYVAINAATTYVYDATSGDLEECATAQSLTAGNWTVASVQVSAVAMAQTGGPQHFDLLTVEGGLVYDVSGALSPPVGAYGTLQKLMATDPATSAAWALSTLFTSGIQIGFKDTP